MSEKHMQTEKYSVSEYAKAQRRLHKQILREQQKAAGIAGKRNTRQVGNGDFVLKWPFSRFHWILTLTFHCPFTNKTSARISSLLTLSY